MAIRVEVFLPFLLFPHSVGGFFEVSSLHNSSNCDINQLAYVHEVENPAFVSVFVMSLLRPDDHDVLCFFLNSSYNAGIGLAFDNNDELGYLEISRPLLATSARKSFLGSGDGMGRLTWRGGGLL